MRISPTQHSQCNIGERPWRPYVRARSARVKAHAAIKTWGPDSSLFALAMCVMFNISLYTFMYPLFIIVQYFIFVSRKKFRKIWTFSKIDFLHYCILYVCLFILNIYRKTKRTIKIFIFYARIVCILI